jgi:hypothetical protein
MLHSIHKTEDTCLLQLICWQIRPQFHWTRYTDARTEIVVWKATPKLDHPAFKPERTRQTMYVQRNIKVRSCNHYCREKPIRVIYSEFVFVTFGIRVRGACAVLHCLLWPVWLYHIFPQYLIKCHDLQKKFIEHKMCFDIFYKLCLKHFSF